MKKAKMWLVLLLLVSVPSFGALTIQKIRVDQIEGDGFTASYSPQTLQWSGGASVSLYSSLDGSGTPVATFSGVVNIAGTFTGLTDMSSGTTAKASFSSINWSISVLGIPMIWGTEKPGELFIEEEQFNTGILWGSGIVQVTGCAFGTVQEFLDYCWDDDNGDARLKSQVIVQRAFNSYLTNSYSTKNTTMWLFADESVIPEPATMALLGLGSLVVLRKRR